MTSQQQRETARLPRRVLAEVQAGRLIAVVGTRLSWRRWTPRRSRSRRVRYNDSVTAEPLDDVSAPQKPWWWRWLGIGVAVVVLGLVIWRVPPLLYSHDTAAGPAARLAAETTTRTALIAATAGLVALWSVIVNSRNLQLAQRTLELNQEANRSTLDATREGQIADRYTKAIAQLGSEKLPVRLGGIYALERLAVDSERDHGTVVEVLSAYARDAHGEAAEAAASARSLPEPGTYELDPTFPRLRTDVQAAVTVLGRLPRRLGVTRADLAGAHLEGAWLGGAHLEGAGLAGVHLDGANLNDAHLEGANLVFAHLRRANLNNAHLERAVLMSACMEEAHLNGAFLEKAELVGARLAGASLIGANLEMARLGEADLTGADLRGARLWGADLEEGALDGAVLDSASVLSRSEPP